MKDKEPAGGSLGRLLPCHQEPCSTSDCDVLKTYYECGPQTATGPLPWQTITQPGERRAEQVCCGEDPGDPSQTSTILGNSSPELRKMLTLMSGAPQSADVAEMYTPYSSLKRLLSVLIGFIAISMSQPRHQGFAALPPQLAPSKTEISWSKFIGIQICGPQGSRKDVGQTRSRTHRQRCICYSQ